jgi:outer membrane biosynthesis protein TonB
MTLARTHKNDSTISGAGPRAGIILSVLLHAALLVALFFMPAGSGDTVAIIAAGEGEGGEGGGGAIEVGVADQSAILGFQKPETVSYEGDTDSDINNMRLESTPREDESPDEVLPKTERDPADPTALKTNRPVVNQQERVFTGKDERGRSSSDSVQQGRTFGSAQPASMRGGVGVWSGGSGAGTGLPGGSAYGRLIQGILSGNYNPRMDDPGTYLVIITIRIARDGRILSWDYKQQSPSFLVNKAAERAIKTSDPLPPFPADFLPRAQAVTADLWFRYPK